ncbi:MAG: UTRA domain-containing protein [Rhodobacteraceae bacterium]|nr:UTRA domain-containing protein [Paracoccaceae bacterium]
MPQNGSLPLYQQISELLIRDIAAGRLTDGARLAPERDMAAGMGIAVGTLRKALADLTTKGLLERVQGSGNYIRAKTEVDSVYALFRLELPGGGGLPTAEVLSVARLAKPADLPPFGTSAEAHRIRRLRRLSGAAAAVEEIWLDGSYIDRIAAEDLSESLYLFYRERLGLWIQRAEDQVGLGAVPGWAPDAFAPPSGTAAPLIERLSWAQDGTTAEFSRTWFDPKTARYVARIR